VTTSATRSPGAAELRARRVAAGLTQQQLANRAAVSVRTVQGLESGEFARPRPSTLRRLDDVLTAVPRATPPDRAGRPYADRVPTDQNRDQITRNVTLAGLPDRYARPARVLAAAPPRGTYPLFWLEVAAPTTVITTDGPVSEARVILCRALPVGTGWRTSVLAAGVAPLDGVELVDALRAFRGPIIATHENH
jgi:transcriptional regulator with XRE-family HTH domain